MRLCRAIRPPNPVGGGFVYASRKEETRRPLRAARRDRAAAQDVALAFLLWERRGGGGRRRARSERDASEVRSLAWRFAREADRRRDRWRRPSTSARENERGEDDDDADRARSGWLRGAGGEGGAPPTWRSSSSRAGEKAGRPIRPSNWSRERSHEAATRLPMLPHPHPGKLPRNRPGHRSGRRRRRAARCATACRLRPPRRRTPPPSRWAAWRPPRRCRRRRTPRPSEGRAERARAAWSSSATQSARAAVAAPARERPREAARMAPAAAAAPARERPREAATCLSMQRHSDSCSRGGMHSAAAEAAAQGAGRPRASNMPACWDVADLRFGANEAGDGLCFLGCVQPLEGIL